MANRKFFNCGMLIDPITKLLVKNVDRNNPEIISYPEEHEKK